MLQPRHQLLVAPLRVRLGEGGGRVVQRAPSQQANLTKHDASSSSSRRCSGGIPAAATARKDRADLFDARQRRELTAVHVCARKRLPQPFRVQKVVLQPGLHLAVAPRRVLLVVWNEERRSGRGERVTVTEEDGTQQRHRAAHDKEIFGSGLVARVRGNSCGSSTGCGRLANGHILKSQR